MNEGDMTIKELAEELGVSKQAIRKHVNKLPPTMVSTGINHTIYINADGQALLRKLVSTKVSTKVSTETLELTPADSVIEILQRQSELLEKELSSKNSQINSLQSLLDQQQKLHGKELLLLEQKTDQAPKEPDQEKISLKKQLQQAKESAAAQSALAESRGKANFILVVLAFMELIVIAIFIVLLFA